MGFLDFILPGKKKDPEKLLKKATEARKVAHFREAIRLYEQVIKIDPKNDRAYVGKGSCLIGRANFEEAIKCFDKAIEINPENPDALHSKGIALKNMGHRDEGDKYIMKANSIARKEK